MNQWSDCGKCNAKGTMAYAETWEGSECVSCGYTTSSFIICPECKGDQRIGTPACGCGSCKVCGYRVSCMPITPVMLDTGPVLDTLTMGTAGASIERESHTKTLDLLRRARNILLMKDEPTPEDVNTLLDDILDQCPIFKEEDEK